DNTQSIICAFGLAAAVPRSPYRHLELCGIALSLLYDAAEENARGYGRKISLKIVKPDEDSASTENAAKKVLLHQNQMQ
ncbi:hypothetical protein, partial [Gemmiger sp.]